jgi:hypothetical protein
MTAVSKDIESLASFLTISFNSIKPESVSSPKYVSLLLLLRITPCKYGNLVAPNTEQPTSFAQGKVKK